jgi:hypothetical protein
VTQFSALSPEKTGMVLKANMYLGVPVLLLAEGSKVGTDKAAIRAL